MVSESKLALLGSKMKIWTFYWDNLIKHPDFIVFQKDENAHRVKDMSCIDEVVLYVMYILDNSISVAVPQQEI